MDNENSEEAIRKKLESEQQKAVWDLLSEHQKRGSRSGGLCFIIYYKSNDNWDTVSLVGFGTFKVVERKARKGRNPQTGETMKIKAKNVVKFKPGKKLKDAV